MSKKGYGVVAGVVVAAVILAVLFCVVLVNHAPVILDLAPQVQKILPRGSCEIVCNATDPDGDALMYGWSAEEGTFSGEGSTVTWTAPASTGAFNVTVIVADTHGGAVTDYVVVTVRANKVPSIESLAADADWTLPSGSLNLTCDASDPDDDLLTYEWSASGGDITGAGPEVVWTAPEEVDVYYITVVVRDEHGSSDTATRPVSVVTGEPLNIEAVHITAEHCYLREYSWGCRVGKEKEYSLECVVSDAGTGLAYEWSCTGGLLSGDGPVIAWTAPNTPGQITITVIVSEITGNKAAKNLLLEVASCSSCTFPGCTG